MDSRLVFSIPSVKLLKVYVKWHFLKGLICVEERKWRIATLDKIGNHGLHSVTYKEYHTKNPLFQGSIFSSLNSEVCIINSFLIISQYIFHSIKYHCSLIHPLNDWHVDYFYFVAILNQLEVNAPIQVFLLKHRFCSP